MHARVGDVAFSLRGQLSSEVGGVLVLDVFDDGVPAVNDEYLDPVMVCLTHTIGRC